MKRLEELNLALMTSKEACQDVLRRSKDTNEIYLATKILSWMEEFLGEIQDNEPPEE
jgi:hypothetical protein